MTAGIDGQLLATLGSVVDSDNPAASQRCTNAGGVASVDKRSTQLKEGALQNGLPEPVAIPNDREELAQKGVILFFSCG